MRLVATVVALATVLLLTAGCGDDQDPTMAGSVPSDGSSSTSPSSSPSSSTSSSGPPPDTLAPPSEEDCGGVESAVEGDLLILGVAHGELRAGAAVTWTLTVTNTSDTAVELVFGTGQDGEVVLTQDQDEVYRWSDEMAFTQAVRCQTVPPGGSATYELPEPVLDVAPGQYQLRASLAAEPKPFDIATQVTVSG